MEKPQRVPQVYGYTVCLVAVIAFIISVSSLIPAIMDLGDPMHAGSMFIAANSPSLASFENYKMDVLKSTSKEGDATRQEYIPDDATLKKMFEAAKEDRISNARHMSMRTIYVCSIIILISIGLFAIHWVWMRRIVKKIIAAQG